MVVERNLRSEESMVKLRGGLVVPKPFVFNPKMKKKGNEIKAVLTAWIPNRIQLHMSSVRKAELFK